MNDIEQERLQHVRKWLSYADEDLRLAQHGLKLTTSVPYRLIAYHAQQSVEKCLKAYLVHKGIDFPYTAQYFAIVGTMRRASRMGGAN